MADSSDVNCDASDDQNDHQKPRAAAAAATQVIDLLDDSDTDDNDDDAVLVVSSPHKKHKKRNRSEAFGTSQAGQQGVDEQQLVKQVQGVVPHAPPERIRTLLEFYGANQLELVILNLTSVDDHGSNHNKRHEKRHKRRARQPLRSAANQKNDEKDEAVVVTDDPQEMTKVRATSSRAMNQVLRVLPGADPNEVRRLLQLRGPDQVETVIHELLSSQSSAATKPAPPSAVAASTGSSQQPPRLPDSSSISSTANGSFHTKNDFELVICVSKELENLLEGLLHTPSRTSGKPPTFGSKVSSVQKLGLLSEFAIVYLRRLGSVRNRLVHDMSKSELSEGERFEFREGYEVVKSEIMQVQQRRRSDSS